MQKINKIFLSTVKKKNTNEVVKINSLSVDLNLYSAALLSCQNHDSVFLLNIELTNFFSKLTKIKQEREETETT